MQKTKVIFVGQSHTMIEWLCIHSDIDLVAVFVPRQHQERSAWVSLCVYYRIPLYWCDDSQEVNQHLKAFKISIDLGLCAYFNKLSDQVLKTPRLGFINIHPGILPDYPGRFPSMEAIHAGEREAGVSIHWMNDRLDQGDLIDVITFPIRYQEGPAELERRAMQQALLCLKHHWVAICQGQAPRFPQIKQTIHRSPRWRTSPMNSCHLDEIWQKVKAYAPFGGVPFLIDLPPKYNIQEQLNVYFLCITHATIDFDPSYQIDSQSDQVSHTKDKLNTHSVIQLSYPYTMHVNHAKNPYLPSNDQTFVHTNSLSIKTQQATLHTQSGWCLLFHYQIYYVVQSDLPHVKLQPFTNTLPPTTSCTLHPISDVYQFLFPFEE